MKCEDVEMLMADALGDELSSDDRSVFEFHLAECDRCRQEYETALRAVDTMRLLPGPRPLRTGSIHRRGDIGWGRNPRPELHSFAPSF